MSGSGIATVRRLVGWVGGVFRGLDAADVRQIVDDAAGSVESPKLAVLCLTLQFTAGSGTCCR